MVRFRPEAPYCGFSSSGRAPPCQGGGSEFEPRNPLQKIRRGNIHGVFAFYGYFSAQCLSIKRSCGFDYETTAFSISVLSVLLFSLSVFLCTKIVIKNLLSDSYCLGSYLDKLVIVNKFKAFLKAHSLIGDKS